MQVGILTYYNVHNHGAVLQANGLKKVLEEMGCDVIFLAFERNYAYIPVKQTKKYVIGLDSIPFFIKFTKEKGIRNIIYNFQKYEKLRKFRMKEIAAELKYNDFSGECIIIGSDEVFSLEVGYNPMMYGYGLKVSKIISYAGSFGPTKMKEIEQKEKIEEIGKGIGSFSYISVRDQNSKSIIENLCKRQVSLVCDPVILYGYEMEKQMFQPKGSDYILIYSYDNRMNDQSEIIYVRNYAKRNGYKIYSVGYYHKWCDKSINVSPIELLGWIKHAKLVITDTFHGAVISIVCNTLLVVKIRNNENKLLYLMEEYGLSDRVVVNFADLDKIARRPIDFEIVNNKIKLKREESKCFLKMAIEGEDANS